jgi:hypothetical protein
MVGNVGLAAARAPIVGVGLKRDVQRRVPLIAIAQAAAAGALAAAIVVRDYIHPTVVRIVTGADPGGRGHFRAWRTRARRAATAAA